MDSSIIESVCKKIYQTHREFADIQPNIARLPNGQSVLTFQTSVKTSNGRSLPRFLRVTVDERGIILKTVTSR